MLSDAYLNHDGGGDAVSGQQLSGSGSDVSQRDRTGETIDAVQAGISHEAVGAGERVRGAVQVQAQNVNDRRIDTAERMLRAALGAPASILFNSEWWQRHPV